MVLAGNRDSRRHSTTNFSENDVVAGISRKNWSNVRSFIFLFCILTFFFQVDVFISETLFTKENESRNLLILDVSRRLSFAASVNKISQKTSLQSTD